MNHKMTLGVRIGLGFGALILIIGGLGAISYFGAVGMRSTGQLAEQGNEALAALNECAVLRRDFDTAGFGKDAAGKTAADRWTQAYASLKDRLDKLHADPALDAGGGAELQGAISKLPGYQQAFGRLTEARRKKDTAFAEWSRAGNEATEQIAKTTASTIAPGVAKARESGNVQEFTRWAGFSEGLDRKFVQPFLLLRVQAVYMLAQDSDERWQAYCKQLDVVQKSLAAWAEEVKAEPQLAELSSSLGTSLKAYEKAGADYRAGVDDSRAAQAAMAESAGQLVKGIHALGEGLAQDMTGQARQTVTLVISVAAAAVAIGLALAVLITRSIVRPIRRIIEGLNEGADQVNEAAGQVASASQSLAAGASEQASSLEETSSALEEVAAMTRTSADNARQANELATQARAAADQGDRTMTRLNAAMTAINESSDKISKIIKVIEEISFQTNLLALNAAVEAARAGEHGKGFAVVADEVRNLAQRAAQAAKETTALIEDSVGRAREGTEVAGEVGKALTGIVSDVSRVTDLIDGIAKASNEQAQGVDQVNMAVSQMDKVTQQNAAGAEESASAAEELSAQSQTLRGMVGELVAVVGGSDAKHPAKAAQKGGVPQL